MDLKCLIGLLLEKGYIEDEGSCFVDDEFGESTVMKSFKFEYNEIFEKIKESKYNKDIVHILKERNKMFILNSENLERLLIKRGDGEEIFGFRADRNRLGAVPGFDLKRIINEKTRFDVKDWNFIGQRYFKLHDLCIEEERVLKEIERRDEILDFLDKLP